jgi:hypothetical protein
MIMIPTQRPVLENLNSHHVDLSRLTEHCQGEFGSSCIHLRAPRTEGVIFFDNDAIPSSVFQSKHEQLEGQYALYWLVEAMNEHNSTRLCFFRRTYPPDFWRVPPKNVEMPRARAWGLTRHNG